MKPNIKKELQDLRTHMANNKLEPLGAIIPDNQRHLYSINGQEESRYATYIATSYPFEEDPNGPALICSYGLIDEKEQYSYSSLRKK